MVTLYKCICFRCYGSCRVSCFKVSRSVASSDYHVTSYDSPHKTRRVNSCNWILADITTVTPLHKSLLFFIPCSIFDAVWKIVASVDVTTKGHMLRYLCDCLQNVYWISQKCIKNMSLPFNSMDAFVNLADPKYFDRPRWKERLPFSFQNLTLIVYWYQPFMAFVSLYRDCQPVSDLRRCLLRQ